MAFVGSCYVRGTGFLSTWRSSQWEMYLDSRELLFDDGSTTFPMNELVNVKLRSISKEIQVRKNTGVMHSSSKLDKVLLILKLSASTFSGQVKQHISVAFADKEEFKDFLLGFQSICNHHNLIEAFSHNRDILLLMSELLLEGSMEIPTQPEDSDDDDTTTNNDNSSNNGNRYRNDTHDTHTSVSSGGKSSMASKGGGQQNRRASINYDNYYSESSNNGNNDVVFHHNLSIKALSELENGSLKLDRPSAIIREENKKIIQVLGIDPVKVKFLKDQNYNNLKSGEIDDIEMGKVRRPHKLDSDSDIQMLEANETDENNESYSGAFGELLKGFNSFGRKISGYTGVTLSKSSFHDSNGRPTNNNGARARAISVGLGDRSYSSGVVKRRTSSFGNNKRVTINSMNRDFEDIRGISAIELRRDRMNSVSSLFNEGFATTGESAFDSIVTRRRSTLITDMTNAIGVRNRSQSAESINSEEKPINEFEINILNKDSISTKKKEVGDDGDHNIVQKVQEFSQMVGKTIDDVIHYKNNQNTSEPKFETRKVLLSTEQLVVKMDSKKEDPEENKGDKTKSVSLDGDSDSGDLVYPMQRVVVSVVADEEDDYNDNNTRIDSRESSRMSVIGNLEEEAAAAISQGKQAKLTTFKMKFYDDQKNQKKGVGQNQAKFDVTKGGNLSANETSCDELVITLNNDCPMSRKFFRAVAYHACVHNVLALYYDMGWDIFDENEKGINPTKTAIKSPSNTSLVERKRSLMNEEEKKLKMREKERDIERELSGTPKSRLDSDDDGSSQHHIYDTHLDLDYDDMYIAQLRSNKSEVDVSGWILDTEQAMKLLRRRLQKRPVISQHASENDEDGDKSDIVKKNKKLRKDSDKLERKNFRSRPAVSRLLASECQIDDEYMMMLARILNAVRSVEYLDISCNPMGFKGGVAISNMLFSSAGVYLLELDVSGCHLGDVVMGQFADALLTPTCNLNILNVSENNVTKLGCSYIAGSLKENNRLRELNLSSNAIGSMGARDLAACLSDNNTLRILNVNSQYKQIGPEGAVHLARLLRMESNGIQVLRVGGNGIGFDGCRHLAGCLLINTKLQELDLGGINYITIAGAKQIAQALLHNVTLAHITVGQVRLPVFDLRGVEYLLPETLGQNIPYPPSEIDLTKCMLEEYTASYEGMRDEMAIVAVTLMQKNDFLQSIKISPDSDFIPVSMLNGSTPSCKTLDLSNRNYKGIDAIIIGGLMLNNRFLTEICLEGNDFAGSEGENWIAYALEHTQIRFDTSRWNVKQMYVDGYKTLASMRGLSASGAFIEPQRLEGCFYEFLTIWAGVMYYYAFAADVIAINQMRENEENFKKSWVIFYCVFVCLPTLLQCKNSFRVVFHDPMKGLIEMLLIVFQTTAFFTTKASVKNNMETTEYLDHKYVNGVYRTIPLIILQFYITFVVVEKNGTLFGAEYLVQASFLSLIGVTVIFIMIYDRMHARRMSMLPRKEQPGCAVWLADWLATCGMGADDDAVEGFVNFDAFYTSHYVWAWIYQFLSLTARVISTTWFVASVLMIDPYKTGELAGVLLIVIMFGTRFIYSFFMEDIEIKNISGFLSHIVHSIELLITDSAFKQKEGDENVESNLRNWIILISWTNLENLFCCVYGYFFNDYSQLATSTREGLFILVIVCIFCRCLLFYFWLSVVHFPSLYVTGEIMTQELREKVLSMNLSMNQVYTQNDNTYGVINEPYMNDISSGSPGRAITRRRSELFERLKGRKNSWDINMQLNKLKFKDIKT